MFYINGKPHRNIERIKALNMEDYIYIYVYI